MPRLKVLRTVVVAAALFLAAGCGTVAAPQGELVSGGEGPHAASDRKPTATEILNGQNSTKIVRLDLGNSEIGEYAVPVRGTLVIPTSTAAAEAAPAESGGAAAKQPLIIVNHLRAPGCSDDTFAYPCTNSTERRFDIGMTYLGEHLAGQGYAVLIPDLSPVWIGADVASPYDQTKLWQQVVSRFVAEFENQNSAALQGIDTSQLDTSQLGLVLHSRSGILVNPAVELFGAARIKGVLAYGAAYDTFDAEMLSPAPADVPYLAVSGDLDADVGASANLWLGAHLGLPRSTPAIAATVPGLGHMYVNRVLSEAGLDDRIGCEELDCPDAAEHERFLREVAADWFGWAFYGADTSIPVTAGEFDGAAELAGLPARWLAASPAASSEQRVTLDAAAFKAFDGGSATLCVHPDPMQPGQPDNACPEPTKGVTEVAPVTPVNVLQRARAETTVTAVRTVAVHVAAHGSSELGSDTTALLVTLRFAEGTTWEQQLTPAHPVLRNRATAADNGQYLLGTVRLVVPAAHAGKTVTAVELRAPAAPVELRAVDLLR
ncbi:hypothetical protein EII31_03965 [Leucobacter sp. OH2974_COT-288]|nr:hypothetical protein EII31_03965 [Leucobacter sp. OH2974_COT-288]